jgi:hypothetical protein
MKLIRTLAILVLLAPVAVRADAPQPAPLPPPTQAAPTPQPVPRPVQLPTDAPEPAPIADAPKGAPDGAATAQNYGARDPECQEWTDACRTCIRDEKGATQCSTPGVACTLGPVACKVKKQPPIPTPAPTPSPESPKQ